MNKKRIRSKRKMLNTRKRVTTMLIWGGIGLAAIALVVFLVSKANPASQAAAASDLNQVIQVPVASRSHIPVGSPLPNYSSDPPAGGDHYPNTMPTKFYTESDLASLPVSPVGYLVHNLEHGYVIFWYNCQAYKGSCNDLTQQIQQVMSQFGGVKVIAFPYPSIDVPVVLTSWGRMLRLSSPNQNLMKEFVQTYRGQAPEPDGP